MSPFGDCTKGPHGPIGDWDVSGVTKMGGIFSYASGFNRDLSKWDVSSVTSMGFMFAGAYVFNKDLSKWDVSAVTNMGSMFARAAAFNQDLSTWDVSAVTNMRSMFSGASAFEHKLCGVAWVNSNAEKSDMFIGSKGSISSAVCETSAPGYDEGILCLYWILKRRNILARSRVNRQDT